MSNITHTPPEKYFREMTIFIAIAYIILLVSGHRSEDQKAACLVAINVTYFVT
jgi:hypothetical protein